MSDARRRAERGTSSRSRSSARRRSARSAARPSCTFAARRLHRGRRALPLFAPHLHPSLEQRRLRARSAARPTAWRCASLHSDAALHRRLCPDEPVERLVFELLEQFRVEALAPRRHARRRAQPAAPLRAVVAAPSTAAGLTDTAQRPAALHGGADLPRARHRRAGARGDRRPDRSDARRARAAARPRRSPGCAAIAPTRPPMRVHALAIARTRRRDAARGRRRRRPTTRATPTTTTTSARAFSLLAGLRRARSTSASPPRPSGRSRVLDDAGGGYRVFTTAYDREHARRDAGARRAAGRVPRAARPPHRRPGPQRRAPGARAARRCSPCPRATAGTAAQEEGHIDGRRLAQLVASPTERRLFRIERMEPVADCVVSFLIDCSGSMKEHIESVAMLVDVFARALEQAGVASEVLGFTTGAWNGGRAQRDWLRAGRPRASGPPQRGAATSSSRTPTRPGAARGRDIAALLKADLFREGIDGEAVDWACARLRRARRGAAAADRDLRRLPDGQRHRTSPTTRTTSTTTCATWSRGTSRPARVEICGVGVGLDLSPYYSRSHVLDLAAPHRQPGVPRDHRAASRGRRPALTPPTAAASGTRTQGHPQPRLTAAATRLELFHISDTFQYLEHDPEPSMDSTLAKGLAVSNGWSRQQRDCRVTDVAQAFGMARSNAHRTLQTLVECGWAVQDAATSAYRPSLRLFELGALVAEVADIGALLRPHLAALAAGHRRDHPPRGARRRRDRLPRQVRQPAAGGRVLAHRRARAGLLRRLGQGAARGGAARRRRAARAARHAGRAHAEQHHRLRRARTPSSSARAHAAMPRTARNGASASAASARRSSTRAAKPVAALGMSVPSIRFARTQARGLAEQLIACARDASATLGYRVGPAPAAQPTTHPPRDRRLE